MKFPLALVMLPRFHIGVLCVRELVSNPYTLNPTHHTQRPIVWGSGITDQKSQVRGRSNKIRILLGFRV